MGGPRSEPSESGRTSPEELIAAAHAACSAWRCRTGSRRPEHRAREAQRHRDVDVRAGHGHHADEARRDGIGPGIDEAAFAEAAEGAAISCPVSSALDGNVEILLDARLAS